MSAYPGQCFVPEYEATRLSLRVIWSRKWWVRCQHPTVQNQGEGIF